MSETILLLIAVAFGAGFAVQSMRLSFYKGYFDQKQKNKKMMHEMAAKGASPDVIASALKSQLR